MVKCLYKWRMKTDSFACLFCFIGNTAMHIYLLIYITVLFFDFVYSLSRNDNVSAVPKTLHWIKNDIVESSKLTCVSPLMILYEI